MKAVFGTNLKTKQTAPDGLELITLRPNAAAKSVYDRNAALLQAEQKKAATPAWVSVIQYLCYVLSVTLFYSLLRAGLSHPEGYQRISFLLPVAIVFSVIAIILSVIRRRKKKLATESEGYKAAARATQESIRQLYASMDIPQNAVVMDVLYYGYKPKKNKLVPTGNGIYWYIFENKVVRVYAEENDLCLVSKEGIISIPRRSITGITTVKRSLAFPHWNKPVSFLVDPYKQYRITQNAYGQYMIPRYYRLDFTRNGEQWELLFPNYELPLMEHMTGLKAN